MANILKPSGVNNIWAATGTKTDPGVAKANTGWVVELPPYQTANWIEFRQDSFIAHVNQHGIPEWDSTTEYQANLSYVKGSDGLVYKCLTTNTNTDPVNPLNSLYWTRAFETYGSVQVVSDALNAHLANYATLSGLSNTALARVNLSVYSRTEGDSRYAYKTGDANTTFSVKTATNSNHAIPLGQLNTLLQQATEAQMGVAAIASNADVAQGVNDTKIITPLKAATVYLSKAGNLAGLTNTATARANLGLGSIAIEASGAFLRASNNLSDLASATVARANLGLTSTATRPEDYFLRTANNLSDVSDVGAARTSLGLTSAAITAIGDFVLKADNLAGLANIAVARTNLGLGAAATQPLTTWLQRANNLSDLTNVQAARNNLGLGGAATKDTLGVTGDLNFTNVKSQSGYTYLPNGLILQWGLGTSPDNGSRITDFPIPFPTQVLNIQVTYQGNVASVGVTGAVSTGAEIISTSQFRLSVNHTSGTSTGKAFWQAIGY